MPRIIKIHKCFCENQIVVREIDFDVIVDDQDFEKIKSLSWQWVSGYAVTSVYSPAVIYKKKRVAMHRLLVDAPHGFLVHHKNENKLDNRRENLEILTRGEHVSLHTLGKTRSAETRSKMSKAQIGPKNHAFGKKLSGKHIERIIAAKQRNKRSIQSGSVCPER